jgi:DNA-binding NarL/FixJ family response regulator
VKSLVLIEDHDLMRHGLYSFFSEKEGWELLGGAGSLAEAEALIKKLAEAGQSPDLALLDIELSGAWGLELVPRLKSSFPEIRILVYSVFEDFAHVGAAMRSGVSGYVCKSQSAGELESAMQSVLDGGFFMPAHLAERFSRAFDRTSGLTRREREIFDRVQRGQSNREIAEELGVSLRTVENNLSIIYDKTGVKDRKALERL